MIQARQELAFFKYSNVLPSNVNRWRTLLCLLVLISFTDCQETAQRKSNIVSNEIPPLVFDPISSVIAKSPKSALIDYGDVVSAIGTRKKASSPIISYDNTDRTPSSSPHIIPVERRKLKITPVSISFDTLKIRDKNFGRSFVVSSEPIEALPMRFKDDAKFNIQYLDAAQGLPSSFVYSMIEDRKGNLWFGTYGGGVCRYDGNSIYTFSEKEGLPNNRVRTILEDSSGNLWFGTNGGGAIKYDGSHFEKFSIQNGLSNDVVSCIYQDSKGRIWFGQKEGYVSCLDGDRWFTLSEKDGVGSSMIRAILEDSKGNIWLGTEKNGVAIYNGIEVISMRESNGLASNKIRSLIEDNKGNIWIASNGGGLTMYDGKTIRNYGEKNGLPNTKILSMVQDREGNIWLGTYDGGVIRFDGTGFQTFKESDGMSNNTVLSILQDSSDNLWFGTNGGGVSKLKLNSFNSSLANDVLSNNTVRAITEDRLGNLWFCTDGDGVTKYDGARFETYTEAQGLFNGNIYCMLEDRNGHLWFGTRGGGVVKFDGEFFTNYTEEDGLAGSSIRSMLEDIDGNLWFGSYRKGVSKFDGSTFVTINKKSGLASNTIRCITEDRKGNIWLGTDGGGASKIVGDSIYNYSEETGLASNIIMTIYEDKKGNLWFGTWGSGLSKFDGQTFETYTKESGLTHDLVLSIQEDRDRNMWIGTEGGLTYLKANSDNSEYEHASLTKWDGLKRLDLTLNATCLDANNQLWWGLGKGISTLDLNSFELSTGKPKLQLNNVRVKQTFVDFRRVIDNSYLASLSFPLAFGDMMSPIVDFYNYPEQLKLPAQLNHVSFHFSALDWTANHKLQYQYILEGLDDEWSPLVSEGVATYRNIPYGKYVFRCRAIGETKVLSEEIAYPVTVITPWDETRWANILFFAMFAGVLFGLYRWRTNRMKYHQNLLKQTVAQRTSELKTKSNELKTSIEELNVVNANLEKMVADRTAELTRKNETLSDYAFMNAHNLRVPVANIKGIIQLFEYKMSMEEKVQMMGKLKSQSDDLDDVLIDIQRRLEKDELLKDIPKR